MKPREVVKLDTTINEVPCSEKSFLSPSGGVKADPVYLDSFIQCTVIKPRFQTQTEGITSTNRLPGSGSTQKPGAEAVCAEKQDYSIKIQALANGFSLLFLHSVVFAFTPSFFCSSSQGTPPSLTSVLLRGFEGHL